MKLILLRFIIRKRGPKFHKTLLFLIPQICQFQRHPIRVNYFWFLHECNRFQNRMPNHICCWITKARVSIEKWQIQLKEIKLTKFVQNIVVSTTRHKLFKGNIEVSKHWLDKNLLLLWFLRNVPDVFYLSRDHELQLRVNDWENITNEICQSWVKLYTTVICLTENLSTIFSEVDVT